MRHYTRVEEVKINKACAFAERMANRICGTEPDMTDTSVRYNRWAKEWNGVFHGWLDVQLRDQRIRTASWLVKEKISE